MRCSIGIVAISMVLNQISIEIDQILSRLPLDFNWALDRLIGSTMFVS